MNALMKMMPEYFFKNIMEAIEYAHNHKIIHRDLKLENILLSKSNKPMLADWGFACYWNIGEKIKYSCGTIYFAAPEIINDTEYTGPEIDIWSLGVLLYAIVTGRFPFAGHTMKEIGRRILDGQYLLPSYLSPEVVNLISKMIAVNPLNRATMAEIKNHVWFTKDERPAVTSEQKHKVISTPQVVPKHRASVPRLILPPHPDEVSTVSQVTREKKKFSFGRLVLRIFSRDKDDDYKKEQNLLLYQIVLNYLINLKQWI